MHTRLHTHINYYVCCAQASVGDVVCMVPCTPAQGVSLAADAAVAAVAGPQLVLVVGGFRGSSAAPAAACRTAASAVVIAPERTARQLARMTASTRYRELPDRLTSPTAEYPDGGSGPSPRASSSGLLGSASDGAASPAAAAEAGSSPQHRKAHRRWHGGGSDATADQPHQIADRPGATQYEQLTLSFSLVRSSAVLHKRPIWSGMIPC